MNNTIYTSKEKNYEFSSKNPSATKHSPPSNVYYIVFYRNFLFQNSLIGIVKPKFTRRNEIWCRIWEIEDLSKNVRKTQDRTSLKVSKYFCYYLPLKKSIDLHSNKPIKSPLPKDALCQYGWYWSSGSGGEDSLKHTM